MRKERDPLTLLYTVLNSVPVLRKKQGTKTKDRQPGARPKTRPGSAWPKPSSYKSTHNLETDVIHRLLTLYRRSL